MVRMGLRSRHVEALSQGRLMDGCFSSMKIWWNVKNWPVKKKNYKRFLYRYWIYTYMTMCFFLNLSMDLFNNYVMCIVYVYWNMRVQYSLHPSPPHCHHSWFLRVFRVGTSRDIPRNLFFAQWKKLEQPSTKSHLHQRTTSARSKRHATWEDFLNERQHFHRWHWHAGWMESVVLSNVNVEQLYTYRYCPSRFFGLLVAENAWWICKNIYFYMFLLKSCGYVLYHTYPCIYVYTREPTNLHWSHQQRKNWSKLTENSTETTVLLWRGEDRHKAHIYIYIISYICI